MIIQIFFYFFCLEKNKYGSSCDVNNDECNILLDLKCANSKCDCSNLTYWNGDNCGKKFKKNNSYNYRGRTGR